MRLVTIFGRVATLAVLLGLLSSCAQSKAGGRGFRFGFSVEEADEEKDPIVVVLESTKEGLETEYWKKYGYALAGWYLGNHGGYFKGRGGFYAEIFAIEIAAEEWEREERPDEAQIQLLMNLASSPFMMEYAIRYLAVPSWWIGGDELQALRWDEFEGWSRDNLPADHEANKGAMLLRRSALYPWGAPPGLTVFELVPLDPKKCAEREGFRSEALARWEEEEARIGALVISTFSLKEFASAVVASAGNPRAQENGIVWGWPTVANLFYEEGFCRVHLGDNAGAEAPLRKLLELAPTSVRSYGELAHVLTQLRSYDEAHALLDRKMELTEDPCEVAHALRAQGAIYIEMGKLALAKSAYLQSLELDDGSALAKSQLRVIQQRWDSQNQREIEPANYVPPERLRSVLGECRRR